MAYEFYVLDGPTDFYFPHPVRNPEQITVEMIPGGVLPKSEYEVIGYGPNSTGVTIRWKNAPLDANLKLRVSRRVSPQRLTYFEEDEGATARALNEEFDNVYQSIQDFYLTKYFGALDEDPTAHPDTGDNLEPGQFYFRTSDKVWRVWTGSEWKSASELNVDLGTAATYDVGTEDDELPTNQIVDDKIDAEIPAGVICMWSGSTDSVPSGWALCDGTNGTPDLRDRFVIGAGGGRVVDETSDGSIPSHTHDGDNLFTHSTGAHRHDLRLTDGTDEKGEPYLRSGDTTESSWFSSEDWMHSAGVHSHSIGGSTGSAGTGTEVIAKYYALAYIMKL